MGTRVAPSYANLFMRKLENEIMKNSPKKPTLWLRYIDDIFFIWNHGENALKEWVKNLNAKHGTIKFTLEHSRKQINFLDTLVKIDENNTLYTTLYTKPTDSHSYLRYDSAHPPHCKNSLPYSQFLRLKRICSKRDDFVFHSNQMKEDFKHRGYPNGIIKNGITKSEAKDRETLLKPKPKIDDDETDIDKLFFVQTFRPCKNSLTNSVRENWNILGRSKSTKDIHRSKLITSFKKPKSIKDHLVKARIDYHPESESNEQKVDEINKNTCTKVNCKYCTMITKTGNITSKVTKQTHGTKHNVTCNSSNVIYCIECTKCNMQYVGQTKCKIKDRMREHMYHINKKIYNSDVAYHFNTANHCGTPDMKIHIVDIIYEHPDSKRAKSLRNLIEFNWIHKIQSSAPNGLNTLDNRYG